MSRPMKFKKGDLVTFSAKCPKKYRGAFKKGPRKIVYISGVSTGYPYNIGSYYYRVGELQLAKK